MLNSILPFMSLGCWMNGQLLTIGESDDVRRLIWHPERRDERAN